LFLIQLFEYGKGLFGLAGIMQRNGIHIAVARAATFEFGGLGQLGDGGRVVALTKL